MKVTLEKYGGFAAMRRSPIVVDAAKLPENEQAELQGLVAAVREAPPVLTAANEQLRDAMSYRISIDDDGATSVHQAADTAVPESFKRLMQWVERHAGTG